MHVATHFIFPKMLLALQNPHETKPLTVPLIPAQICPPVSNPAPPQTTPHQLLHRRSKTLPFLISALCCPPLTNVVLLKTWDKNGWIPGCNSLGTLICLSLKGVKQDRNMHRLKKKEEEITYSHKLLLKDAGQILSEKISLLFLLQTLWDLHCCNFKNRGSEIWFSQVFLVHVFLCSISWCFRRTMNCV